MNWNKSIAMLKAHVGAKFDKELYEKAGIVGSVFSTIKRGTAHFSTIERLCNAFNVKPSQFIQWGEK